MQNKKKQLFRRIDTFLFYSEVKPYALVCKDVYLSIVYDTERKPKNPLSPPPMVKSMSSQFDIMRHRLLNSRPEETVERPQEVPQVSESHSDISQPVQGKYHIT